MESIMVLSSRICRASRARVPWDPLDTTPMSTRKSDGRATKMHHIENDISTIVATSSTVGYLSFQLPAQSPLSLSNQDRDFVPL
jgi:hypothetical protein